MALSGGAAKERLGAAQSDDYLRLPNREINRMVQVSGEVCCPMMRSQCILRIGATRVCGVWMGGGRQPATAEAVIGDGSVAAALSAVLAQTVPRARLASPFASVGLSGAHVRAAIMPFVKLPKTAGDRALLISQRFCREFRLDASLFAVTGSPLGRAENGVETVLCVAVPHALLAEIHTALAARGLYADEIAPEFVLRFAGTRGIEAPGMVLMGGLDSRTVLVWDERRTVVHVAFLEAAQGSAGAERRTAARISRYARIAGHERAPVAVYADGAEREGLARMSGLLGDGVKLLRWPAAHGGWASLS
jgi:hypothetical protein